MPTEAQQEEFIRSRIKEVADDIYRERNGLELDASIERWKRTLEHYDRELAGLPKEDTSKQHRWTVSPSIAFRADERLAKLLALRDKLKTECRREAAEVFEHIRQNYNPETGTLCPPKSTEPAAQAASQPAPQPAPAQPQQKETADAPPIAA